MQMGRADQGVRRERRLTDARAGQFALLDDPRVDGCESQDRSGHRGICASGVGQASRLNDDGLWSVPAAGAERAKRFPTPRSPGALVLRRPRGRSRLRAPRTIRPSPFPATAWFATAERSRDTPGASNANMSC